MPGVSYAFAFIAGTFLECVMYGIFLALLIAASYVQWDRYKKGQGVHRVMVFTMIFFGFTITTNCILSVYQSIRAVFYAPPGVTVYEYLNPPYPTLEVFRLGLFQFQILVGDVILAHRMYHVYDKSFLVCVIPAITITALFATGCGVTNQLRDLSTPRDQQALNDWSSACFCLTIFNSLFMTIAISVKMWVVYRETTSGNIRSKDSVVLRAMKVLIESAALWTTFVGMNFLTFLAKSNLVFTFLALTGPAVGISFCLIIVRLGQVLPEQRHESWHMSFHTPGIQSRGPDEVSISFSHVRDSGESSRENISKQGYFNDSTNFPRTIRALPHPPSLAHSPYLQHPPSHPHPPYLP